MRDLIGRVAALGEALDRHLHLRQRQASKNPRALSGTGLVEVGPDQGRIYSLRAQPFRELHLSPARY